MLMIVDQGGRLALQRRPPKRGKGTTDQPELGMNIHYRHFRPSEQERLGGRRSLSVERFAAERPRFSAARSSRLLARL
jgi:hypothetical protein